jgi:hypothetical protein
MPRKNTKKGAFGTFKYSIFFPENQPEMQYSKLLMLPDNIDFLGQPFLPYPD